MKRSWKTGRALADSCSVSCNELANGEDDVLSRSRHKDTDHCLYVASVPVPCENGSGTSVADGGHNQVSGLWGRTLGES